MTTYLSESWGQHFHRNVGKIVAEYGVMTPPPTLTIETANPFETFLNLYQTTRHHSSSPFKTKTADSPVTLAKFYLTALCCALSVVAAVDLPVRRGVPRAIKSQSSFVP
jgi:hypothetical protein